MYSWECAGALGSKLIPIIVPHFKNYNNFIQNIVRDLLGVLSNLQCVVCCTCGVS